MGESNRPQQIVELVVILCSAFDKQADEPLFAAYELGLEGIEIDQLKAAVKRAIQTCKFMPRPAELREMAEGSSAEYRAAVAWDRVRLMCQDLRKLGSSGPRQVDFNDKILNAVIRNLGGVRRFIETYSYQRDDFETWLRRDFERVYATFTKNGITEEMGLALRGPGARQDQLNNEIKEALLEYQK